MKVRVKKASDLTERDLERLWVLYGPNHNVSREEFEERTLCSFDKIVTCTSKEGSEERIVGFTGIRTSTIRLASGKKVVTMYFGQAFVDPKFRGRAVIQNSVVREVLKVKLRHPFRKFYTWDDAISYRSYLLTLSSVPVVYPSPGRKIPPDVAEIRDHLGRKYYGNLYDPDSGTVRKDCRRVKEHVETLTAAELEDERIQYYLEKNPGYQRGDGLLVVIPATLRVFLGFALAAKKKKRANRETWKARETRGTSRPAPNGPTPGYQRNEYDLRFLQVVQ
ncbi:MAG: hypothetical protein ACTSU5_02030 [Promethearchaeota archaeon]